MTLNLLWKLQRVPIFRKRRAYPTVTNDGKEITKASRKYIKEVSTEIIINVPPEKVWSILTDFDNCRSWNPIIEDASGEAELGCKFLFANDKYLSLKKTADGTRLIHKELFSGFLIGMFWKKMETFVPAMLNATNSALKKNRKLVLNAQVLAEARASRIFIFYTDSKKSVSIALNFSFSRS